MDELKALREKVQALDKANARLLEVISEANTSIGAVVANIRDELTKSRFAPPQLADELDALSDKLARDAANAVGTKPLCLSTAEVEIERLKEGIRQDELERRRILGWVGTIKDWVQRGTIDKDAIIAACDNAEAGK